MERHYTSTRALVSMRCHKGRTEVVTSAQAECCMLSALLALPVCLGRCGPAVKHGGHTST